MAEAPVVEREHEGGPRSGRAGPMVIEGRGRAPEGTEARAEGAPAIELCGLGRTFGPKVVLEGVDLLVRRGEIHALLGPNGAGKTTLLRIVMGLLDPTHGSARLLGAAAAGAGSDPRAHIGLVPSGDRTFYMRISGLENLIFFARMNGFRRRAAERRAREVLEYVRLDDAAAQPVNTYSHGMEKRLSVARALLTEPEVLLVDEATHDLDPASAARVRELVDERAQRGTAVIWATQRVEEIRGFAHLVTLLRDGAVRFSGGVHELLSHALVRRYLLRIEGDGEDVRGDALLAVARAAIAGEGTIAPAEDDPDHVVLALTDRAVLGDAIAALSRAGVRVISCGEERPRIEEAFLALTRTDDGG